MENDGDYGLFQELKRRKVFRASAAYAAIAFTLLQVTDLVVSGLALPPWIQRVATVIAIVGFPVAVVLAWAYDLTPAGLRRTDPRAAAGAASRPPWQRLLVAGAVTVVVLASGGWWATRAAKGGGGDDTSAVAVVPFEILASDSADIRFAAGLRTEIIGQLSKLSGIRLMSPTAVAAVMEAPDGLARLAGELGVGSVVEGSVQVERGQVRVSVQLSDARTGRTLWTDRYDRALSDVFAVQTDIALRIAQALRARVTPTERDLISAIPTQNAAAWDLYLQAREVSGGGRDGLLRRVELLRQAARLDPGFSLAHSHLAFTYMWLHAQTEPAALDSGHAAVQRAIAADSTSAHAYHVLGALHLTSGRFSEARRAYGRSLVLDPNMWGSMNDISLVLVNLGRYDEALHWSEESLRRSPNRANNYYHTGFPLLLLGDDHATERFLLEGLTKEPAELPRVHIALANLELYTGRQHEAAERMARIAADRPQNFEVRLLYSEIAEAARAAEADSLIESLYLSNPDVRGWILPQTARTRFAAVLLRRGEAERAHRLLDEAMTHAMTQLEAGDESPALRLEPAAIHALRGEHGAAVEWIERAYEAGYREHRSIQVMPALAGVLDDPRCRELLRRMEADITTMRRRAAAASSLLSRADGGRTTTR